MLHPKKIFYFVYASHVDPLTVVGKDLRLQSRLHAVLPGYKCFSTRRHCETIRPNLDASVTGEVYELDKKSAQLFDQHMEGYEKRKMFVMVRETNLLQEVVVFVPTSKMLPRSASL